MLGVSALRDVTPEMLADYLKPSPGGNDGTPAAGTHGSYSVQLTVRDSSGASATASFGGTLPTGGNGTRKPRPPPPRPEGAPPPGPEGAPAGSPFAGKLKQALLPAEAKRES